MKRRSCNALLLFFFQSLFLINYALATTSNEKKLFELSKDPIWKALLHVQNQQSSVSDQNFFLNKVFKDSQTELVKFYLQLHEPSAQSLVCQFPARYFLIKSKIEVPEVSFTNCRDLGEFLANAPVESVSLAFAAESIAQPASMMGHIFLKISGLNKEKNIPVSHAISFFTFADDVPFFQLAFESLVTGKKGFYTLSPYEASKNHYLFIEQRSLWEFNLGMDEFQLKLLQYHLYELKNIEFKYLFHTFNCATLLFDILSVPLTNIKEDRTKIVSPLDLVRSIHRNNYVSETVLHPTSQLKIKTIQMTLDRDKKISSTNEKILELQLEDAKNGFLLEKNRISREEWSAAHQSNTELISQISKDSKLDLSNTRGPSTTPNDSQWGLSYVKRSQDLNSEEFIRTRVMIASHTLLENLNGYTHESDLRLAEVTLDYEVSEKTLDLESLTMFSMLDLNPYDSFTKGFSSRFYLGYLNEKTYTLNNQKLFLIRAGLGQTFNFFYDIDLYYLGGVRLDSQSGFSIDPEVGFVVRQIFNMKTIVSYGVRSQFQSEKVDVLTGAQSLNYKDWGFSVSYSLHQNSLKKEEQLEVGFKYRY